MTCIEKQGNARKQRWSERQNWAPSNNKTQPGPGPANGTQGEATRKLHGARKKTARGKHRCSPELCQTQLDYHPPPVHTHPLSPLGPTSIDSNHVTYTILSPKHCLHCQSSTLQALGRLGQASIQASRAERLVTSKGHDMK